MQAQVLYVVSFLARIFPSMSLDEFTKLRDSIRTQGLLEEITVWRGTVIDGYHRLLACLQAGVEPRFQRLEDGSDPLAFALAKNLRRRHLNQTARTASAFLASAGSRPGRPRSQRNHANLHGFPSRSQAAGMFGVSTRSVATMARVLGTESTASPGLRRAVQAGTVTGSDAARILGEPADVQERAVAMVQRGQSNTVRRAANAVKRETAAQQGCGEPRPSHDIDGAGRPALHVSTVAGLHGLVPEKTVDAVITFPPSKPDSSGMFTDLANFAAHALRPTGGMFVLADTAHLPGILAQLEHPALQWVCALPYRHPGRGATLGGRHGLNLRNKLILIYGKEQFNLGAGDDLVSVPDFDEGTGGNQFSPRLDLGMEMVVRRFTRPGQVVCDPILLNRSETALATVGQGRDFVGAWDDQAGVQRVRDRISRALSANDDPGQLPAATHS